jgi:hypothetical protein
MNDFTEHRDEDQFANGQSCRDLRVRPDLTQPGFQLMGAIDSISDDFFRFVRISAREIALNHRGHSKMHASIQEQADAGLEVVNARLNYLAEAEPKPVNYIYDPPAGVPRSSGKHVLQNVLIRNGRDMLGELSLDTNGFVLTNHETAARDFYDPDEVKSVYYPEVERLIKREYSLQGRPPA